MHNIEKITFDINGKKIELTLEESKQLYESLKGLFEIKQYYPYYDIKKYEPLYPCQHQIISYC